MHASYIVTRQTPNTHVCYKRGTNNCFLYASALSLCLSTQLIASGVNGPLGSACMQENSLEMCVFETFQLNTGQAHTLGSPSDSPIHQGAHQSPPIHQGPHQSPPPTLHTSGSPSVAPSIHQGSHQRYSRLLESPPPIHRGPSPSEAETI